MLNVTIDATDGVAVLEPTSTLTEEDFTAAASAIDPVIEKGGFKGLMIVARSFPGWDSFGALASHLRFVRDHHQQIRRVALVTDSRLGDLAPRLAKHFVAAEIENFPYAEADRARQWLVSA